MRYFDAWTPLAVGAATAVTLTIPSLAPVVLLIVAVAALAGLAWPAATVSYKRRVAGARNGRAPR